MNRRHPLNGSPIEKLAIFCSDLVVRPGARRIALARGSRGLFVIVKEDVRRGRPRKISARMVNKRGERSGRSSRRFATATGYTRSLRRYSVYYVEVWRAWTQFGWGTNSGRRKMHLNRPNDSLRKKLEPCPDVNIWPGSISGPRYHFGTALPTMHEKGKVDFRHPQPRNPPLQALDIEGRFGRGEWIRTTDLLVPNLGKARFASFCRSLQITYTVQSSSFTQ
jgi:hypothetical protein